MSWDLVRAWRERLRELDPGFHPTGLSPEGAREALAAALDALDDESLEAVADLGGRAFPTAAVVAARTVTTAVLEWCAVLLGRGSTVLLKHPTGDPGLADLLVGAARDVGLPLVMVVDHDAVRQADLVIAMGRDETMERIRATLPARTRFLSHGQRFSVGWIRGRPQPLDPRVPEGFETTSWGGVAADAALHDTRGCFSPVAVFTPLPLEVACDRLAESMAAAAARWPVGTVAPAEHAAIRSRRALAKATTGVVREGAGWSVHGVEPRHVDPTALPRSVAVHHVADAPGAARALAPYARWLSAVGTDDPDAVGLFMSVGADRVCRPGRMQRPPLVRPHDGEDWLRATARWISREL